MKKQWKIAPSQTFQALATSAGFCQRRIPSEETTLVPCWKVKLRREISTTKWRRKDAGNGRGKTHLGVVVSVEAALSGRPKNIPGLIRRLRESSKRRREKWAKKAPARRRSRAQGTRSDRRATGSSLRPSPAARKRGDHSAPGSRSSGCSRRSPRALAPGGRRSASAVETTT